MSTMLRSMPFQSVAPQRCSATQPCCVRVRGAGPRQQRPTAAASASERPSAASCAPEEPGPRPQLLSAAPAMVLLGMALCAGPAMAGTTGGDADALQHAVPLLDVSENQEFWGNVVRYGRYFVTVMLGTGYVMLRPLQGLFKNPVTAVLGSAGLVGFAILLKFTLDAMLGMSDSVFEYNPEDNITSVPTTLNGDKR